MSNIEDNRSSAHWGHAADALYGVFTQNEAGEEFVGGEYAESENVLYVTSGDGEGVVLEGTDEDILHFVDMLHAHVHARLDADGALRRERVETRATISMGSLRPGRVVFITTVGFWGTSTSSGIFDGIRDDEGEAYAMFRDGEINGTKQAHFGFPVSHLNHDGNRS